jgi:hypothetical protein
MHGRPAVVTAVLLLIGLVRLGWLLAVGVAVGPLLGYILSRGQGQPGNLTRIATHWPDMHRVAGSLIINQVRAYDLLHTFCREGHPAPLSAAFAAYRRRDNAMRLLALVDPVDDCYHRLMNRQLIVQESRHGSARAIWHGGRGQIRQAYREGQEDELAALGLVLNAVVQWNTRYLDASIAQLRAEAHDIRDEDVARLSPLKDRHVNFLGRYLFNIQASGPDQGLRPLRDSDTPYNDYGGGE